MTINIMVDHTFFEALLLKDNANHELAVSLITYLDLVQLHITNMEYVRSMDACRNFDEKTKNEYFRLITEIVSVINIYDNKIYQKILEVYIKHGSRFTYSECVNIYYMKYRKITNIVSFNENYDSLENINRIHLADKNEKSLLK